MKRLFYLFFASLALISCEPDSWINNIYEKEIKEDGDDNQQQGSDTQGSGTQGSTKEYTAAQISNALLGGWTCTTSPSERFYFTSDKTYQTWENSKAKIYRYGTFSVNYLYKSQKYGQLSDCSFSCTSNHYEYSSYAGWEGFERKEVGRYQIINHELMENNKLCILSGSEITTYQRDNSLSYLTEDPYYNNVY